MVTRLHREGNATIAITVVAGLGMAALGFWLHPIAGWALVAVALLLLGIVLNFFRYPTRQHPSIPGVVVAPCNGKVVVIEEVEEPLYFKGRRLQVSIFMSPLDVHVNYSPISGVFKQVKYLPGKYLVAWHPKSSTENEQTYMVVESDVKPGVQVGFKQIAGALARRICWYVKEGDTIQAGHEFGFIKFGSRVDILLPVGTQLQVQLGQLTTGGETVIGTL